MAYIGVPPFGNTVRTVTNITATSGQTTFNIVGGYVQGYVDVHLNGVLLIPGTDFTATDGLTVVLTVGATAGDEFQAFSYQTLSLTDAYRQSEVDTLLAAKADTSSLATVATTGAYSDLTGTPTIPSATSDLTNDSGFITASNTMGRNRIINGDMRIDQRNAGASITPTNGQYSLDRWLCLQDTAGKISVQQNHGAITPPTGHTNYIGIVSLSAYTPISSDYFGVQQRIEGYNVSDLGFGASGAKTITVSFWVRSSLTGAFGGSIFNSAQNRCYPFSYTINSANTWEYKTATISGDTTGTWLTTNGAGLLLNFSAGAGSSRKATADVWTTNSTTVAPTGSVDLVSTSGATLYITGVQLEVGSVATEFERRPYGTELLLCMRYYYQYVTSTTPQYFRIAMGETVTGNRVDPVILFPVPMRAQPSQVSADETYFSIYSAGAITPCVDIYIDISSQQGLNLIALVSGSPLTVGRAAQFLTNNTNARLGFSAEL